MTRSALALLAALALLLSACGGDDGPRDERAGQGLDGSGQERLLADGGFGQAVEAIGLSPRTRPVPRLGRDIGKRLYDLQIDLGRTSPGSFLASGYRRMLVRRGRLSDAAIKRRYGRSTRDLCEGIGEVLGHLDWRLDEGADPPPDLVPAILDGYGRGRAKARPANAVVAVRDQINGKLPDEDRAGCAQRFKSSYVFVSSLYRQN